MGRTRTCDVTKRSIRAENKSALKVPRQKSVWGRNVECGLLKLVHTVIAVACWFLRLLFWPRCKGGTRGGLLWPQKRNGASRPVSSLGAHFPEWMRRIQRGYPVQRYIPLWFWLKNNFKFRCSRDDIEWKQNEKNFTLHIHIARLNVMDDLSIHIYIFFSFAIKRWNFIMFL